MLHSAKCCRSYINQFELRLLLITFQNVIAEDTILLQIKLKKIFEDKGKYINQ